MLQAPSPHSGFARFYRGLHSALRGGLFPLFSLRPPRFTALRDESRLAHGLVIVLPGIDGRTSLSACMVHGLVDAGLPFAIVMKDWTTGYWPLFLYHLRANRRHRTHAAAIADYIIDYQSRWPDRPVYLVGHSAGGAMAVQILERLPETNPVTRAVLLAPALSPRYDLTAALRRTQQGLWNFHSWLDLLFIGVGTVIFGTVDGRHSFCAGNLGFRVSETLSDEQRELYRSKCHQVRYSVSMCRQFHTGGHFSCVNRVFIAETIAPLLDLDEVPDDFGPDTRAAESKPIPEVT